MKRRRYIRFEEQVEIELSVDDILAEVTDDELKAEVEFRKLFIPTNKYWNTVDYSTKMELFESMVDKFTYDELKERLSK